MLERLARRLVDGLDVLAVDLDRLHAERLRALGEVADRRVLRLRRRLGPVVVLEHEDGGDLPELRHVERLVERADVRRAVAEERNRDARLAAHLERERGARDLRQAAADDGVRTEVAALDVVEVHRAAVAVRAALLLAVQLGHQFVRVRPLRERVPVRAVRRRDHVAVLERAADADGARLLADRHVQEARQLAGAEALLHLLLEPADEQHLAQDVGEIALRERRLCLHLCHGAQFMVQVMGLVGQWNTIEKGLDPRWSDVQVVFTLDDPTRIGRAAALLAPAGTGQDRRHAPVLRRAERPRCRTRSRATNVGPRRGRGHRRHARARLRLPDRGATRSRARAARAGVGRRARPPPRRLERSAR